MSAGIRTAAEIEPMADVRDDLRKFIAYRVREGFASAHEIIEDATEYAIKARQRESGERRAII